MSLTRNLFHEIRPFFRLFDEVARTHPSTTVLHRRFDRHFDDFGFPDLHRPSIDLSEQENEYIVEAELPGVKKENLNVRVSDQGRSITIEGRLHTRSTSAGSSKSIPQTSDTPTTQDTTQEVIQTPADTSTPKISSERGSTHFTRTVWLPRSSKVGGSLADGILTLRIPKAAEQGSVKVDIH